MTRIYFDLDGVLVGSKEREKWSEDLTPANKLLIGHEWWASLPRSEEFADLIQVAERLVTKSNVYILSAPTPEPASGSGKIEWICKHLPGYFQRMILTVEKERLAKPGDILIDDKSKHLEAWEQEKGIGVLMPRPWNVRFSERGSAVIKDLENLFERK